MSIDKIFSVSGLVFYGQDNWAVGVKREFLQSCQLENCYYDEDLLVIKNKDIWSRGQEVRWVSSNIGEVVHSSAMKNGILKRNGEIIPQGNVEGLLGWGWLNSRQIQLYNGYVQFGEKWVIDYEKLTRITTPILDIGVMVGDFDVIVDGFIDYFVTIKDKIVTMTQISVVGNDGIIDLLYPIIDANSLEIKENKTEKILSGMILDNKHVFVDRDFIGVEVQLKYNTLGYDYMIGDLYLYWRGSNRMSEINSLSWNRCWFGDILYPVRYYQLMLEFSGDVGNGYYKLYSLGLRKRKEV